MNDFALRPLPVVNKEAFPLGLACNFGIDSRGVRKAVDAGINYLFWTSMRTGKALQGVREALADDRERMILCAYTATRWRKLLKPPKGWDGPVASASDCYRFCLSHPAVSVVLNGPASDAQLEENLDGIAKGPLEGEKLAWMREFGKAVHG